MLENLTPLPPDKIIALAGLFRADTRDGKVDLGVGVYKNAEGVTPVMRAVKSAERQMWETQTTKSYTAVIGDAGFHDAMADLLLSDSVSRDRLAFAQAPGGTGAIRQLLELIRMTTPDATIWMSDPTWPNHPGMIRNLEINSATYPYLDLQTRTVNFDAMMAALAKVRAGDIVLLHGCCHNPTGANLNQLQWGEVADLLLAKSAIPFIDIAYQGFGDGIEEDSFGTRLIASRCPEVLIAASCSKNFGIYRERTGLAIVLSAEPKQTALTQGALSHLNRVNFSFPPDHGARLVTTVLTDRALRADWEAELGDIRTGMLDLRVLLADALQSETNSNRFGFIAEHRGMFSLLGLSPGQVLQLREEHAIYVIGDSRINVAGLNKTNLPMVAKAIAAVGG